MEKGTIHVQTENILPIIKKFLYSDHEIFLRELVSNAVDATQKLNVMAQKGDVKDEVGDTTIDIILNKEEKTLTIKDRGIGMTDAEVKKYINQIAFSSAEEFLKKYKKIADPGTVIGHFGLGFYSAFMVADKVEIQTKSHKRGSAVSWVSTGDTEFTMDKVDKKDRGTEIKLFISEESAEFLETPRIQGLLDKYCKFLPVEIRFEEKVINNPEPAWKKSPTKLTDEDYQNFYKELYPMSEPPLFWIHLNVDYPFNLTGILYFPKLTNNFEVQKNKIQLYSNQVFVTDSVEEIVPEFLQLLHGVIDSPDIPLNVSRSYLQSDPNVKKINTHITKKVADKLAELFKKDREAFADKWDSTSLFVKYGMMTDEKFYEKAFDFFLVKSDEGKHYTLEEYKASVSGNQTDKDDNVVVLYTNDPVGQDGYIEAAKSKGYSVITLDTVIDSHFVNALEQKMEKVSFKRIDSGTLNELIDKGEDEKSALKEADQDKVKGLFSKHISNEAVTVEVKPLAKDEQPVLIVKPEFMRRMKDMAAVSGMNHMQGMPDEYQVIVNANHKAIKQVLGQSGAAQKKSIGYLYDLARLSQNMLKGTDFTEFVKRSVDLMAKSN
jgi:molecular chaperone HtpG